MNHQLRSIGLFLLLVGLMVLGGTSKFLRDPGTFWHIRCGNLMLDSQQFIQQDTFSFTFYGTPWHPHGWLGEVLLAVLHRVGSFDAILLATCVVLAGLYSWLASRYLALGFNPVLVLALLGLVLAASASHFHARPHILTLLYLAIVGHQLLKAEEGNLARLWWLMPLFVLWANTHGGVLAGVASFGLVLLGWLVAWPIGWPSPVRGLQDAILVCSLGLAAVLTLFINPYGPILVTTIVDLARMPELPRIIQEHAPLVLSDPSNWPFLLCGAVYVFGLAGLREKPRITWLLPLAWLVLGFSRVRHGSLFGVLMLLNLAEFFPRTVWGNWLATKRPDFYMPPTEIPTAARSIALAAVLTLSLGLVLQSSGVKIPVLGVGNAQLDEQHWPLKLVPAMKESYSPTRNKLFNELNHGGFVMFFTPEYQHFVDDRCEMYGGPWLERYVLAEQRGTANYLAEMQAKHGEFNLAITLPDSGYDKYFANHADWVLVQKCDAGAFYQRIAVKSRERE